MVCENGIVRQKKYFLVLVQNIKLVEKKIKIKDHAK